MLPSRLLVPLGFQDVAHLGAALEVLDAAAHVLLVALEAGRMIGGLEPRESRFVGRPEAVTAGLELRDVHLPGEYGRADAMALDAGLHRHRAVLVVAVRTVPGGGHVLRVVERHRFVDLRQAAQGNILR